MRREQIAAAVLAAAVALTGCLGDDAGDVEEVVHVGDVGAVAQGQRTTLVGTGFAVDGEVRLCAALLESFPPQCGQPSVRVEGFDLDGMDGVEHAQGTSWTEGEIQLNGKLVGDVLQVDG